MSEVIYEPIDDYAQDFIAVLRERLEPFGVKDWATWGGLKFIFGQSLSDPSCKIGDVSAMLEGFMELGTDAYHVGDAVAAMALTHFGIEHDLPTHGITLAICGRAA